MKDDELFSSLPVKSEQDRELYNALSGSNVQTDAERPGSFLGANIIQTDSMLYWNEAISPYYCISRGRQFVVARKDGDQVIFQGRCRLGNGFYARIELVE